MNNIEKKFKSPPPEYRSAPFWSWNDELDDKYLQQQLAEMKKGGMAGGFMHSRIGLITPYFSGKWMKCIRNTVRCAKKIGIPVYLYDEDRWPSGFAGGMAVRNRKHGMKVLRIKKLGSGRGSKPVRWNFDIRTLAPSEYFNNSFYPDTLNRKAVAGFIESTYVPYKKAVGNEFNRTIPAIFTDEPNYSTSRGMPGAGSSLPWTDGMDKLFKERYGYDLKKNFVYLVENKGDYRRVRYHFLKLAAELFVNNFGKQIHDWCEENNIPLTGHYLAEDTLSSQIRVLGAAMPLYEYMQFPGVDHLSRQIESTYLTIKQCSSVAHQLGKKRVLSELFGCSGQNMTFTDRKWIGGWNTVLGVNLFCPHLWLYSMAGCRKRDYPPTISYQQPYWKYNRAIEDYFARINFVTNQGKFCAVVLVIHPVESAWCLYNPANTKPVDKLNDGFVTILKTLSGQHYDYDLGDESIIEKWGRSSPRHAPGSRRNPARASFRVGQMSYHLIVIPPVISLRRKTVELLVSFLDRGGEVIGFEPVPERVDGERDGSGLLKQLYSRITLLSGRVLRYQPGSLVTSVSKAVEKDVSVTGAGNDVEIEDIYYQHRVIDRGDSSHRVRRDIYFLANTNRDRGYSARVRIPARGKSVPELWDPVSGRISVLDGVSPKNGYFSLPLYFPEAGSHVIVTGDIARDKRNSGKADRRYGVSGNAPVRGKRVMTLTPSKWVCEKKGLNSVTLDYCQYKTGSMKRWSRPTYVLDVQDIFERKLGRNAPFSIRYSFRTRLNKRPGSVFLALERPEQYQVMVNGRKVDCKDRGYWVDAAFRKIDITDYLLLDGENTIELRGRFVYPRKPKTLVYVKGGTEIESVYVAGDFAVDGKFKSAAEGFFGKGFTIVDARSPLASDTVTSGYPFYAGEFVFSQEFGWPAGIPDGKRVFLSVEKPQAITLKVSINKKQAGLILWPPYCVEISGFLREGRNLIEIEIAGSLRNLLGPHHGRQINPVSVGPGSFNDKSNWTDSYTFVPFGSGRSVNVHLL